MKTVAIISAVAALVCGLIAAHQWYLSSIVDYGLELTTGMEKASTLNKLAARWTAVAVILGSISNIVGALSSA